MSTATIEELMRWVERDLAYIEGALESLKAPQSVYQRLVNLKRYYRGLINLPIERHQRDFHELVETNKDIEFSYEVHPIDYGTAPKAPKVDDGY